MTDVQNDSPAYTLDSLRGHAAAVSDRTGLGVTVEPFEGQYALTVTRPDGVTRHSGYSAETVHGMLCGAAATAPSPLAAKVDAALADGRREPVEDAVRLEGALHLLRYSLDRFIRAEFRPAPEFLRDLIDRVTNDPGEPCDRAQQYTRAEAAEAALRRVTDFLAGIDTPDWRAPGTEVALRIRSLIADAGDDAPRLLGCGFCYEEQGEEVHPHPECPVGAVGSDAPALRERLRAAIDPVLDEHPEHNRIDAHERVLDEITDAALGVVNQDAREALAEARMWARHGYEVGQKHCSWSDHGVAPEWLTEGWPPHFDSCEHLKRACEYDETITRVRAEVARIRSTTPTWGPVAARIEAAIDDPDRPKEQRARPIHPDGAPYSYAEIVAAGWGHCDACGMWTTATAERPHQCTAAAPMANETTTDGKEATDV